MILSLIVYIGSAAVMAWLGWHVGHREQRRLALDKSAGELPVYSWEIVAAIIFYVAVSSVRWLTSWDYNMYYGYFVSMQSLGEYSRENFEPGFVFLTNALARSGFHFAAYFGFWAALQICLLYYSLRHRKVLLPWIALCIFLGPYYIQWMNTIRQTVIECLFVIMVELIVRRRFWLYVALSLAAMLIHRMSVLLIPLYFVPLIRVRYLNNRWLMCGLLALCAVLGQFPQWIQWLFERLGEFAGLLGYGHYYRLFSNHNLEYVFRIWTGPARLFPLISAMMMVWYYPAIMRMFKGDAFIAAIYRFSILHIAFLNVFANTTLYLRRPGDLLRGVFLVMVCYTLLTLWRERRWLPFSIMAFLNFYYIFYELFKVAIAPAGTYFPQMYHTFLLS